MVVPLTRLKCIRYVSCMCVKQQIINSVIKYLICVVFKRVSVVVVSFLKRLKNFECFRRTWKPDEPAKMPRNFSSAMVCRERFPFSEGIAGSIVVCATTGNFEVNRHGCHCQHVAGVFEMTDK
ncbi:hypothetical protein Zmor_014627 [Zophobas morio]|uniref:Uncharacterized protein n=1 Tax=Zophobas morio TaxID=2755281 RepID=A0AA38IL13_9CUCU|nr:hypothetical protein Zmor_014627 [Zophobas morio]